LKAENLSKKDNDGKLLFSKLNFDVQKTDKIAFLSRDPLALTTFFEVLTTEQQQIAVNRMGNHHYQCLSAE
jgi:ATPase subunit of ABC transporter with duplicated ATPase domains